jgi:hypothetical protein
MLVRPGRATLGIRMNARNPLRTLVVLVVVLAVAATFGAVVANVTPPSHPVSVKPERPDVAAVRTALRARSHPARRPQSGEVDITAYVNLYAVAGVVTCFGLLAYWGWWQTHHRCPSCGSCPGWCRCGEATRPHGH